MPTIDERYDGLMRLDAATVINWSHISTAVKGQAIKAILQQEYDVATYNAWAADHGEPLLPEG